MRKPLLACSYIVIIVMAQFVSTAPSRKSLRAQLDPNYVRAMAAYKKLEPRLPRDELRALTTIAILNGAKEVEQQMAAHLVEIVKDLLLNTDMNDKDNLLPKIEKIEKQLLRDQHALEILISAMDLATKKKDMQDFKQEMKQTLQQVRRQEDVEHVLGVQHGEQHSSRFQNLEDAVVGTRIAALRQNILKQVNTMKNMVDGKIEHTLEYLIDNAENDGVLAKASNKIVRKRDVNTSLEEPAQIRMIKSLLTEDDIKNNLIDNNHEEKSNKIQDLLDDDDFDLDNLMKVIKTRSSLSSNNSSSTTAINTPTTSALATVSMTTKSTNITTEQADLAKQEEAMPENPFDNEEEGDNGGGGGGGGGGGLVGIIASLSGGEGGSDIGALIGALTGVISNLFGPGGLDIEALIGTGTSLLAGLLAGNKNFGTVLGNYVGLALDGVSGGGGAINNGQFLGNFLGTVVAALSADPEEEGPPQPFTFAQNLLSSFIEAKNRKASEEVSEERKGQAAPVPVPVPDKGGSDSGGFVKHIVSHIVASAVSFVLNASLGASGGASGATSAIFHTSASSSHHAPAKPSSAAIIKSW